MPQVFRNLNIWNALSHIPGIVHEEVQSSKPPGVFLKPPNHLSLPPDIRPNDGT
jgi:hypothetical protein